MQEIETFSYISISSNQFKYLKFALSLIVEYSRPLPYENQTPAAVARFAHAQFLLHFAHSYTHVVRKFIKEAQALVCILQNQAFNTMKFSWIVCCILACQITFSLASEGQCIDGSYHKPSPSPETNEFKTCHAFKENSCCTAEFTVELVANETKNLYNHSWHRCGQLSEKCQQFWVKQVRFLFCTFSYCEYTFAPEIWRSRVRREENVFIEFLARAPILPNVYHLTKWETSRRIVSFSHMLRAFLLQEARAIFSYSLWVS